MMKFKSVSPAIAVLFFSSVFFSAGFPNLVIMTEDYAPYNFKAEGKVQGIAVDLMVEMLKKVGSSQSREDIKLLPWARGYRSIQEMSNAVLFSTTRTKEREALFKWVCPINTLRTEVIALKSRQIKVNSVQEMLNYRIGCVRDDVGEQLIMTAGVPIEKLDRNSSYETNVKKLVAGRIDLFSSSMTVATEYAKRTGIDPNLFESVYILDESHLCYAFNPNIPNDVIGALQAAYDELITDGTFDKISKKYRE